jgi:hypothetical protein
MTAQVSSSTARGGSPVDLTAIGCKGFVSNGCSQINFRRDHNGPPQKPRQPLDCCRIGRRRDQDSHWDSAFRHDDPLQFLAAYPIQNIQTLGFDSLALTVRQPATGSPWVVICDDHKIKQPSTSCKMRRPACRFEAKEEGVRRWTSTIRAFVTPKSQQEDPALSAT